MAVNHLEAFSTGRCIIQLYNANINKGLSQPSAVLAAAAIFLKIPADYSMCCDCDYNFYLTSIHYNEYSLVRESDISNVLL